MPGNDADLYGNGYIQTVLTFDNKLGERLDSYPGRLPMGKKPLYKFGRRLGGPRDGLDTAVKRKIQPTPGIKL
jgi:hypothetical protein